MHARALILFALWLSSSFAAECCTIPVFRYALDHWEADKLHLVLSPSASKDAVVSDLLRPLRANGKVNLGIETSKDVAAAQSELLTSTHNQATLWKGDLDAASLGSMLDSSARKKIVESILSGDSVIWVVADSGSADDTANAKRIEKRLRFLEQVATLPVQDANDLDSQLGAGPPLKLHFSMLRLRTNDPAEQMLLKMLAGPKGDIDAAKDSFAAAVFGRGRVLASWKLADLDDPALEDACMFLTGRCSCRVKDNNPGWDLLLNVDWESKLKDAQAAILPTRTNSFAKPEIIRIEPRTP